MNRKCKSSSTKRHGPKRVTFDPRGENNNFSILRTGLSWSKFAKITGKSRQIIYEVIREKAAGIL